MDVTLTRESLAAHVDQMSVQLRSWRLATLEPCCETNTFVCLVLLGRIVRSVVPSHAVVQHKF